MSFHLPCLGVVVVVVLVVVFVEVGVVNVVVELVSADLNIINGTEIMLIKLIIAVRDIDSATSPFANFVRTFEVTPPGAAAIIITPRAISKGVLNVFTKMYAITGSSIS